jgi:hypothetical protein
MDATVTTSAPEGNGPAGSPDGPATGGPVGAPGPIVVVTGGTVVLVD